MKSLAERMKDYEAASRVALVRRVPLVVRVDGRAFKTFTARLEKGFV